MKTVVLRCYSFAEIKHAKARAEKFWVLWRDGEYQTMWRTLEDGLESWFIAERLKFKSRKRHSKKTTFYMGRYLEQFTAISVGSGQKLKEVKSAWCKSLGLLDRSIPEGFPGSLLSYYTGETPFNELRFEGMQHRLPQPVKHYHCNQRVEDFNYLFLDGKVSL